MSHILLIDDDEDMTKIVVRWFTKAGYEVSTATSGRQALDFLAGEKPDIILLDYAMPEMDGPATFKEIRSNESLRDIPILFRTGKEDEGFADIMESLHPDGVVSKAEGKPKLLKAVADILQK